MNSVRRKVYVADTSKHKARIFYFVYMYNLCKQNQHLNENHTVTKKYDFRNSNHTELYTNHKTELNTHRTSKPIRYTHTTGTIVTITRQPKVHYVMEEAEYDLRR
jgi:hypothetical protein